MRIIEHAINNTMGCDKDTYMEDKFHTGRNRIARYAWVYFMYKHTVLNHMDLAELVGRNQSNISRMVANVEMWLKNKSRKENQYITQIKDEIKQKIKQRDAVKG